MLEKLIVSGLVEKYPMYIQSVGSLPYSQDPGICLCPERDQSSPRLLFYLLKMHFISTPVASKWSSFLRYTYRNLCTPLFSPYVQRAYALHESTNVRHFKSLCRMYSYDPHLKPLVDFHEISYQLV